MAFRTALSWIVDRNGMAALILDQSHTRNVGFPVTNENHVFERNGALLLWYIFIDNGIVVNKRKLNYENELFELRGQQEDI